MQAVIETPTFIADCRSAGVADEELAEMIDAIAIDPLAGDLIPGTGGARKRRFAGRGKGKSGGYRTISYFAGDDVPVVMLALISKGQRANISRAEANALRQELARFARDYRDTVRGRVVASRTKGRTK